MLSLVRVTLLCALAALVGCAPSTSLSNAPAQTAQRPPLVISGIPDQNASTLEQIFGQSARYLAKSTGLDVRYAPAADYAAIVTAFKRGDVQLAFARLFFQSSL